MSDVHIPSSAAVVNLGAFTPASASIPLPGQIRITRGGNTRITRGGNTRIARSNLTTHPRSELVRIEANVANVRVDL